MDRSCRVPPNSRRIAAPRRGHILIVDEMELSRLLLRHIVEHEGHEVVVSASGEDALEHLSHVLPLGVLVDLQVTVGGKSLLKELLRREELALTPVFVLAAAETSHRERQDLLDLGVQAVIEKPFSHEDIVHCLRLTTSGEEPGHEPPVSSRVSGSTRTRKTSNLPPRAGRPDPLAWACEVGSLFSEIVACAELATASSSTDLERATALSAILVAGRKGCSASAAMTTLVRGALPSSTIPPPFRADLLTETRKQLAALRERLPADVSLTFAAVDPSSQVLVSQSDLEQLLGEFFEVLLREVQCIPRRSGAELHLELSPKSHSGRSRMELVSSLRTRSSLGRAVAPEPLSVHAERRGGSLRTERHAHVAHWTLELPTVGFE